jgi:hypothetical protein
MILVLWQLFDGFDGGSICLEFLQGSGLFRENELGAGGIVLNIVRQPVAAGQRLTAHFDLTSGGSHAGPQPQPAGDPCQHASSTLCHRPNLLCDGQAEPALALPQPFLAALRYNRPDRYDRYCLPALSSANVAQL